VEETLRPEVVDHVEERELDGVGEGVVVEELGAEVGFEVFEDGEEFGVDGLLVEFEGVGSFVSGRGSALRECVDAGVFGGDLFGSGRAIVEEEGKSLCGSGVGEHEANAYGYFADCVAVHPGDAAFKLL
jgi:hypothetical protein